MLCTSLLNNWKAEILHSDGVKVPEETISQSRSAFSTVQLIVSLAKETKNNSCSEA